jgi:hypothetical protein
LSAKIIDFPGVVEPQLEHFKKSVKELQVLALNEAAKWSYNCDRAGFDKSPCFSKHNTTLLVAIGLLEATLGDLKNTPLRHNR